MALRANVISTGSQQGHADAICGELAPNVTAAGSTQATATLLRRLTRHIVTAGTPGGVIVTPGINPRAEAMNYGDEIEVTNASGADLAIYPPLGAAFYGIATNTAISLGNGYSVSILMQNVTTYQARYYFTPSAGTATVSSVGLALPATEFSISGSPVTTTGTLTGAWISQTQNKMFASPNGSSGIPSFRAFVNADLPASGVSAASYTYASITVNAQGIITSAANGSAPVISANPTASVGPAAVNGVATTYMRSDAAPALANTAVTPGAYTYGGFTVDAQGRLTAAASGTAPVTSVGLSLPSIITVSGSPVTGTGTLTGTLATQTANTVWAGPTTGSAATPTFRALVNADIPPNTNLATILIPLDGAGSAITTGIKLPYVVVDFACTITQWTLLGDVSGSLQVDILLCTYAQFDAGGSHPVAGDKITASAPPTISSATKGQGSTLSGWTTAIPAGSILVPNVIGSPATITKATLAIKVTKT